MPFKPCATCPLSLASRVIDVLLPTTHAATPEWHYVLLLLVYAITTPSHYSCYVCAALLLLPLALVNASCLSIHTLHAHLPYSHGLSTHSQVQPISQPLLCAQVEVCVCCSVSFDVNVRPSRFTFSLLTTSARNTHNLQLGLTKAAVKWAAPGYEC